MLQQMLGRLEWRVFGCFIEGSDFLGFGMCFWLVVWEPRQLATLEIDHGDCYLSVASKYSGCGLSRVGFVPLFLVLKFVCL